MDAQAKLTADGGESKFKGTTLVVGSAKDFHDSLHGRLGEGPCLEFERAMRAEHCERADSQVEFTTANYSLQTTPALEWMQWTAQSHPETIFLAKLERNAGRSG